MLKGAGTDACAPRAISQAASGGDAAALNPPSPAAIDISGRQRTGGMVSFNTDSSSTGLGITSSQANGLGVPAVGCDEDQDGAMSHEAALEEALDFEVHIDLARLRDLAAVRIPEGLRGKVYPLLLGVAPVDKTAELTTMRSLADAFAEVHAVGRGGGASGGKTTSLSPVDDPQRGRRLKRFLGSDAGRNLPPSLRQELATLSVIPAPQLGSSSKGAVAAAAAAAAAAASGQPQELLGSHHHQHNAGAGGSGAERGSSKKLSSSEQDMAAKKIRQLVAVEAVLAAHIPVLKERDCLARGEATHQPPLEVVANTFATWALPEGDQPATKSSTNAASDGACLAARRPPRRHFSEPFTADVPFQWHLWLAMHLGAAMDSAQDAFFCAESLASTLSQPDGLWSQSGLRDTYSVFVMVLHHRVGDIYEHLHDLGVNGLRWAPSLLGSLFLDRMPRTYVLELLDYYVAAADLQLHLYVCAALLELWMEPILDMEVEDFLELTKGPWAAADLPSVHSLVRAATKLREEARARKLI